MLSLNININDIVPKITYHLNIIDFKNFVRGLLFAYHKNNIHIDIKFIIVDYINNYIKYPIVIDIYKKINLINKQSYLKYYFEIYQLCNNYETNYETNYNNKHYYINNNNNYNNNNNNNNDYYIYRYKLLEIWYVKNLILSIIDEKYKSKFNHICEYINKRKFDINCIDVNDHIFKNNDFIRFFKYSYV